MSSDRVKEAREELAGDPAKVHDRPACSPQASGTACGAMAPRLRKGARNKQ